MYPGSTLERQLLSRPSSLFASAIAANEDALSAAIGGRRLLIVGAAGSIGRSFVRQLVAYRPAALHLVDLSENALVELVRDLRSSDMDMPKLFETYSIDFGSSAFDHLIRSKENIDIFANFSALKHVRSERNAESLMRMIDTNVIYLQRYLSSDAAAGLVRAFSVSTDKTVRPASLMGATKNLMEKCLFSQVASYGVSTTRFANVAFSDGSLLHGFGLRIAKNQPIAAPVGVRRYFITHEEAGQLCLLACFLGQNREVFFPAFDPDRDLIDFSHLARRYLELNNLVPIECDSESDAKARIGRRAGEWPCYFSTSDTSGEKPFEEFFRETDTPNYSMYSNIGTLSEPMQSADTLARFISDIENIKRGRIWSKAAIVEAVSRAVPELDHVELHRNLDQKM